MKSIEDILPRKSDENVAELLGKFSRLIDDTINFGTNLVKWDVDRSINGDEQMPPVLFLRNILELGDAISILVKQSSIDSSKILLRSLLENFLGLEYMLKQDSTQRALSFIVWHTHKNLNLYHKLDSSTIEGQQFKSEIERDSLIGGSHGFFDMPGLQAAIQILESLLRQPTYFSIEIEFQRAHAKRRNPPWYSLFGGPKNVEQLAKHLGHHASYEIFYRSFSGSVHATEVLQSKLIPNSDGTVSIVQLRFPKDAQSLTVNTINFLNLSFQAYYKYRIPERENDYKKWYTNFRKPFQELLNRELLSISK